MENPVLIDYDICEKIPFSNITLRDLFAGVAMQGTISNSGFICVDGWAFEKNMEELARIAYSQADAMLKARSVIEEKETAQ